MSSRTLPANPDLEQYKKQAKELVKGCAAASPKALQRIANYHPRFQRNAASAFRLADAQLTIAREHDFETWAQFASHIQAQPTSEPATRIPVGGVELEANVAVPQNARGALLFTLASGTMRYHPSYRYLAAELNRASIATVLTDLLTVDEEIADFQTGELALDLRLLGKRAIALTDWMCQAARFKDLPMGYFAAGNGAAAAVVAGAHRSAAIRAIVSADGRPDLAGPWLWKAPAPALFVVGRRNSVALGFTNSVLAFQPNTMNRQVAVIEGVHKVLEEREALQETADLAVNWFQQYFNPDVSPTGGQTAL